MEVAKEKFNEGLAEFKHGNFGHAFALFTEAAQWDSEFAEAFYHLGILYDHKEDRDMALRYYEMALAANPDHYGAQVQVNLGESAGSASAASVTALSDQEFFVRLDEESTEATENLMEAIESSGLAPKLQVRGRMALKWLNIIAKILLMIIPPLAIGVYFGGLVAAMGFGELLPNIAAITLIFYLLTWIQNQEYW